MCGSLVGNKKKFSWDLTENDNLHWSYSNRPRASMTKSTLYLNPGDNPLKPIKFELIGKMRLTQYGRFASDHWGLWMEFHVRK